MVDEIRDDYGQPVEEPRHPNILTGKPWPAVAQGAWEASVVLQEQE
jgi:hypothetical protein